MKVLSPLDRQRLKIGALCLLAISAWGWLLQPARAATPLEAELKISVFNETEEGVQIRIQYEDGEPLLEDSLLPGERTSFPVAVANCGKPLQAFVNGRLYRLAYTLCQEHFPHQEKSIGVLSQREVLVPVVYDEDEE